MCEYALWEAQAVEEKHLALYQDAVESSDFELALSIARRCRERHPHNKSRGSDDKTRRQQLLEDRAAVVRATRRDGGYKVLRFDGEKVWWEIVSAAFAREWTRKTLNSSHRNPLLLRCGYLNIIASQEAHQKNY